MSKTTVSTLQQYKQDGKKFATLTAYDASFAKLFSEAGVGVLLVGDSLGMVLQGHADTVPVSVDDMAYHVASVSRGAVDALVIADMPFMSYTTPTQTYETATQLMQAGANMVKLEGGEWLYESIRGLTERGVPVCGHLGLTPQSVHLFGGFKVQGRQQSQADKLLSDAKALEAAGAQLLVLECIPTDLAATITQALSIPVIGIGAGPVTDGQILVMHDLIGLTPGKPPKFSKNFLTDGRDVRGAVKAYIDAVDDGSFPAPEHSFSS